MATNNASLLRAAQAGDLDALCEMIAAFNAEDGHPLENPVRPVLAKLIADATLGQAFMIEADRETIGYVILCHSFSIEFGGHDTILDEIYIHPDARGKGYGTKILHALEDWSLENGLVAIHLEVMAENPAAALYRRTGYRDRDSRFMSKRLPQK
ncbi:MAG: GNAT family N-acetyltransferase [Rhodobiaceae bacterium]|nr:GNAT family N-acetyltransferase [Rhodobiaceae bacterium]MCC0019407.1 GNAT family N-acetyltransferase [Rhodobiaceae bacterium]MCC0050623.1 GNAT family N-acetyltransferase [Rhodobiaceae bacterium]MCC0059826.1 GNAT family N-acetyltransferase [Rhodobiaceae bacterium]